jgi:hypothetical protein
LAPNRGTASEATTIATTMPNDFRLVFSNVRIKMIVRTPIMRVGR